MIVVAEEGRLRLVTQSDHAHFSGELLSLWRADGLPEHPRRRELLFAAREHDNGWREADAAPTLDPDTGRPHDFLTLPAEVRRELWRRGTARYAADRPYAAMLITEHALALHQSGEPEWREVREEWLALRQVLLEETAAAEEVVAADYGWIDLADFLSLTACWGRSEPFSRGGVSGRLAGTILYLDPFPLAGATSFRVPCRWIPDRPYRSDSDVGAELAAARWRELSVRVAPAEAA